MLDVWVSHNLTQKNLLNRISAYDKLLNRNELDIFLKRMATSNEKWIRYDNIKQKRLWSKTGESSLIVAKLGLTARKVLLCV